MVDQQLPPSCKAGFTSLHDKIHGTSQSGATEWPSGTTVESQECTHITPTSVAASSVSCFAVSMRCVYTWPACRIMRMRRNTSCHRNGTDENMSSAAPKRRVLARKQQPRGGSAALRGCALRPGIKEPLWVVFVCWDVFVTWGWRGRHLVAPQQVHLLRTPPPEVSDGVQSRRRGGCHAGANQQLAARLHSRHLQRRVLVGLWRGQKRGWARSERGRKGGHMQRPAPHIMAHS